MFDQEERLNPYLNIVSSVILVILKHKNVMFDEEETLKPY